MVSLPPVQCFFQVSADFQLVANPVAVQGLARREGDDYANGWIVDGVNVFGRRKLPADQNLH